MVNVMCTLKKFLDWFRSIPGKSWREKWCDTDELDEIIKETENVTAAYISWESRWQALLALCEYNGEENVEADLVLTWRAHLLLAIFASPGACGQALFAASRRCEKTH